ncbi:MAG: GAF domain-containing protein [Steroidobacteraceae bacterium]
MDISPPTTLPGTPEEARTQALAWLEGVLTGERDPWANLANAAAVLFGCLPGLNWAGFYLLRGGELVLGPFQGRPACVRIPLDRGVCGAAARTRSIQRVDDVLQFEGHIACDAASRSELVVPLMLGSRLLGVLDLDSPLPGRFSEEDAQAMEAAAGMIASACDWALAALDPAD